MEKFLKTAAGECTYSTLAAATKRFRKLGNSGAAKLGVAKLARHPEIIWYALDGPKLTILPVFKDYDVVNYHTVLHSYVIDQIMAEEYFLRHGILYRYDANCRIKQVAISWNEDLAALYAQTIGITPDSCSLVKLFTIGRTREFVCIAWLINDENEHLIADFPVFAEDRDLFVDENGQNTSLYKFDYEIMAENETFLHDNDIWQVKKDATGRLFIEKTPMHIIRKA